MGSFGTPFPGKIGTSGGGTEEGDTGTQDSGGGGFDWKSFASILGVFGNLASSLFGGKQKQSYPTDTLQFTGQNTWEMINDLVNRSNILNTSAQTTNQQVSDVTPTMSPEAQDFMSKLIGRFSEATKPVDITGIRQQGLRDVNTTSDMQRRAVENIMASRGLGTSPVSGTSAANVENQRAGEINRWEAGIPILQNQLNTNNLGAAANFFASIPRGQTGSTTGTQSQFGQQTGFDQTSSQKIGQGTTSGQDYRFQGTLPEGYWAAEEAKRQAAAKQAVQPRDPRAVIR